MKMIRFLFLFAALCVCLQLTAQNEWTNSTSNSTTVDLYRQGRIGVGVNAATDARYTIYAETPANQSGNSAIRAVAGPTSGFADWTYTIAGLAESGFGYAVGVRGDAISTTPSNQGRAFGVMAQASNATPGANYGLYATLRGSNNGTAILGWDQIHDSTVGVDLLSGNEHWAGYFIGDVRVTSRVGVGSNVVPTSMLSVNTNGDSRWTVNAEANPTTNGAAGIVGTAGATSGFADQTFGVRGIVESGFGYTTGVRGDATTSTPSNDGRAYGVRGIASNATPGANFGVYGQLSGNNNGAGVFGIDYVKYPGQNELIDPNASWAGYFAGDVSVSEKVAIGTTNLNPAIIPGTGTTYRLMVCGGILGKELFINNSNWCDYVFEDDYKLTPLRAVKEHIDQTGHLHNTPSAADIETAGGIELGEMTRNQQEKIEEIFLHLIELETRVDELSAENARLRSQIRE